MTEDDPAETKLGMLFSSSPRQAEDPSGPETTTPTSSLWSSRPKRRVVFSEGSLNQIMDADYDLDCLPGSMERETRSSLLQDKIHAFPPNTICASQTHDRRAKSYAHGLAVCCALRSYYSSPRPDASCFFSLVRLQTRYCVKETQMFWLSLCLFVMI
ncbi:uncharacterized protein LOC125873861 [Solanum stenotomum]|uniref:uncharacterized protein LOC125873861 n=1 Tax=Solanum stenotomum TaxID=172797 RepID=UPI0020D0BAD4|nr:uncharacterized protein LOC125873861 [Solanum stenotomum]